MRQIMLMQKLHYKRLYGFQLAYDKISLLCLQSTHSARIKKLVVFISINKQKHKTPC